MPCTQPKHLKFTELFIDQYQYNSTRESFRTKKIHTMNSVCKWKVSLFHSQSSKLISNLVIIGCPNNETLVNNLLQVTKSNKWHQISFLLLVFCCCCFFFLSFFLLSTFFSYFYHFELEFQHSFGSNWTFSFSMNIVCLFIFGFVTHAVELIQCVLCGMCDKTFEWMWLCALRWNPNYVNIKKWEPTWDRKKTKKNGTKWIGCLWIVIS